jgi:hypothetical protein
MTAYYKSQRIRNIYDPAATKPYKISRSKLDLFIRCPRCFYLDRRLGVGQPPGYPFNLNSAVDALLKKEFDYYRQRQEPHPLLVENGIEAIPYLHPQIDEWRDSLRRGIQFQVPNTNFILTGGVDDVWINTKTQELIIVDYKATSKAEQVSLDADWQIGYTRQAEVYQWLFRQNGFKVSDTAYFVYCNGRTNADRFDKQLLFDISLLPYVGSTEWVELVVQKAHECLCSNELPPNNEGCDFCQYTMAVNAANTRNGS